MKCFKVKVIKEYLLQMHEVCILGGAHKTKTTPYHPESDGLVERFNRTLLMMLALFAGEVSK